MRVASAWVTHLEIAPLHRRPQIGVGGRPAHAVPHRHVEAAESLLLLAVEVGAHRIAGLPARLDEGVVERIALGPCARRQRPVAAAIGVGAAAQTFGAAEIGQHVAIAPARRAFLLPALEIERIAAHIDEAVDRGRAAEDLAARAVQAPAVQMRLGLGLIAPVIRLHVHRDRQRRRHLDEDGAIGPAVLQHQYACCGRPRSAGRRARSPPSRRRRSCSRRLHPLSRCAAPDAAPRASLRRRDPFFRRAQGSLALAGLARRRRRPRLTGRLRSARVRARSRRRRCATLRRGRAGASARRNRRSCAARRSIRR